MGCVVCGRPSMEPLCPAHELLAEMEQRAAEDGVPAQQPRAPRERLPFLSDDDFRPEVP